MGCFSFICKNCGKGINSDSEKGENVRLSLLEKGKVIEQMQGPYNSYGGVFDENGKSIEWKKDWDAVCNLMFSNDKSNGIAATHVACYPEIDPQERSSDDPNQGWGTMKSIHMGKCEIYHKTL